MGRRLRTAVVALRAAPAPAPGIAGFRKTNFAHQPGDGFLVEAKGGGERGIEGVGAAGRANLVGMAGETVGEIDPKPLPSETTIGERGAARVGLGAERRGTGSWQLRHGLIHSDREQGAAPALGSGLDQRNEKDVERTEPDLELVQRLTISLLEMGDGAEHRLARHNATRVGKHCCERPHPGRAGRIGGGGSEISERVQILLDLSFEPSFEPLPKRGPRRRRQAIESPGRPERGLKQRTTSSEAGENMTFPSDREHSDLVCGQLEGLVLGVDQRLGAPVKLVAETALGGRQKKTLVG